MTHLIVVFELFLVDRYLDQQKPGGCSTYSLEGMWKCFYDVEPLNGLSEEDAKYVLGGQACQWSEGISEYVWPPFSLPLPALLIDF